MLNLEEKILAIVSALEDIKATDITIIDTSKRSTLFDRMVIASANSTRQTRAIADNVSVKLKELGEEVMGREGDESSDWVLVDLGDVLVHVMQHAAREYYNLEELWNRAEAARPKLAKLPDEK
ncbi:MAG: ribosome silencing factor [Gallionellales bacterium CG_4_10_14_3_um_filter_54_96]|nr:ribosome silencing factor [Gallionella sp.]OIO82755.1 MAG: ribosome silencing factor [Gallionellaceae bacterium CG1_02_56_997]PIV14864.1 MAG: ribosome silencing factor [Gallionellales bacterium CG03_land_8_20_14_0_80_55_15]PIX03572.1 MAG: ribosome silencing factor [Gallionellales bacterium CG_4_8_14_3_um_filter_54_18]PIY04248.1 MAG: ribosome silencing factor [Gallionellales bacterium CG_4_10_14_3_um_filter_54_96]PJC03346.1 MAG: ribosome silencing factor [Gallionellales bacterium CG_4_9_14_0